MNPISQCTKALPNSDISTKISSVVNILDFSPRSIHILHHSNIQPVPALTISMVEGIGARGNCDAGYKPAPSTLYLNSHWISEHRETMVKRDEQRMY